VGLSYQIWKLEINYSNYLGLLGDIVFVRWCASCFHIIREKKIFFTTSNKTQNSYHSKIIQNKISNILIALIALVINKIENKKIFLYLFIISFLE
jgi:hypothetical protein